MKTVSVRSPVLIRRYANCFKNLCMVGEKCPTLCGRHFQDHFLENVFISIRIAINYASESPVNKTPALVQVYYGLVPNQAITWIEVYQVPCCPWVIRFRYKHLNSHIFSFDPWSVWPYRITMPQCFKFNKNVLIDALLALFRSRNHEVSGVGVVLGRRGQCHVS